MNLTKQQARTVFDARIKPRVTVLENGCWVPPLKDNGSGYIYLRVRSLGLRVGCHVIAFVAFNGPLRDGCFALHTCDNPSCCRPDHVFAGTQADNLHDMTLKGRRGVWHPIGDKNPSKRDGVRGKLSLFSATRKRNQRGLFV